MFFLVSVVIDGYPVTKHQMNLLEARSIIPMVIFELSVPSKEIFKRLLLPLGSGIFPALTAVVSGIPCQVAKGPLSGRQSGHFSRGASAGHVVRRPRASGSWRRASGLAVAVAAAAAQGQKPVRRRSPRGGRGGVEGRRGPGAGLPPGRRVSWQRPGPHRVPLRDLTLRGF